MFSPIFLPLDDLYGASAMSEAYSFSNAYYFLMLKPLSLRSLSDLDDFSV